MRRPCAAALAAGLLVIVSPLSALKLPPPESPRLAALAEAARAGRRTALEAFWQEVHRQTTPLVERIPGDEHNVFVTFLWRGDKTTRNVVLFSYFTGLPLYEEEITALMLAHLPKTDVWFKTLRMPVDLRFEYALSPNDSLVPLRQVAEGDRKARYANFQADPLNPQRTDAGYFHSFAELPGAAPLAWLEPQPGVAAGRLVAHTFASEALGNQRTITVYVPPGHTSKSEPADLLLLFDGGSYQAPYIPVPTVLDNLRAAGRIPPVVAVFIDNPSPQSRSTELTCHPPFNTFLARELVPWVRANYQATGEPGRTIVGGVSLGGLAAACAAFAHPEVFGAVLSQSGSFPWAPEGDEPEWLARQLAATPPAATRYALAVGLYENRGTTPDGVSLLTANRHLRDLLKARGNPVHYHEFPGGHSMINWRSVFADGLLALIRPRP